MRKVLLSCILFAGLINASSAQSWNITGNNNATTTSLLGTTNSVPVRIATKNTVRMYFDTLGRVGIGTLSPQNILTVQTSGGVPSSKWAIGGTPTFSGLAESGIGNSDFVLSMASNTFNARPVFIGRRSRGTLAAPTVLSTNDYVMSFLGTGYDGTNFQNAAALDFFVDGTPTAGNVPLRISLVTGSNGGNRTERLKVGSTGNISMNNTQLTVTQATGDVGIGVGNLNFTSPNQTIQFPTVPTTTSNPMISLFAAGTQNKDRMVIGHSPSYTNWGLQYSDSLDKFNFLSGGTPVFTTDLGTWRVGVGNSSPAARLDVAGTNLWNLATTEGDFRLGDATHRLKMGVANSGGGAGDAYIASSSRLFLGTANSAGNTKTLSINNNGRVGVGTFAPSAKFHVMADSTNTTPAMAATVTYTGSVDVRALSLYSKPADGYGYGVDATGGYIGGLFAGIADAYSGDAYGVYGYSTGTAGTRYGVYGSASGGTVENWGGYFPTKTYTNELRVGGTQGAAGFVAAINGKLIATEVRVEVQSTWPDYVFRKGYNLMSLEELARKIKAENHLPGIPAAADVKSNGIMLGAMQTKTMEKVEEMTLYILQLNDRIKELEKENSKLKDIEKKLEELAGKIK